MTVVNESPASDDRSASIREWLAVTAVALGTFTLVTSEFLPVGLLTKMAPDLRATDGATGLLMTIPAFVAAIAAPVAMVGAKRIDRRVLLWSLSALLVLSNVTVALASSLPIALLGRVMLGIDVGAFWAISSIIASRVVPSGAVGRANTIIFAGISLGTVVGVPAGAFIGDAWGWRAAFEALATFGILVLGAQLAFLPRLPPTAEVSVRHLLAMFRVPQARLGLGACFLAFAGQFGAYTYMGAFLEQVTLTPPAVLSSLLLGYGIAGFIGNIVGGIAGQRSALSTLAGTLGLMGVAILALTLSKTAQIPAAVAVLAWGFAFGALPIATQVWMLKVAPQEMQSASAVYISILQMGFAAGAFFGGRVVDGWGVGATLVGAGAISVATGVLVWRFGRVPMIDPSVETVNADAGQPCSASSDN